MPTIDYQEHQAKLEEGDVLVIYSDGVTEANNPVGDEFDFEGLATAVIEDRTQPARTIISQINKALVTYTAGAPQADDITLIVARRVPA
jgi:serine phosphatase RsbU (regulator of sigma subunit)